MNRNPIFVVGCGHSGTSIMLAMLDSHSSIWAVPEESSLFLRNEPLNTNKVKRWDDAAIRNGKKRWAEKTPKHILCIGEIFAFDSSSKIIHMLRDGRDVCCSYGKREGCTFEQGIERWVSDNEAAQKYRDNTAVMTVRYEQLVTDPKKMLCTIMQFLDEEFEVGMLDFHQKKRDWYLDSEPHHKLRNAQINTAFYDGTGRWKNEMTKQQKQLFKQSPANALLLQLHYTDNNDW